MSVGATEPNNGPEGQGQDNQIKINPHWNPLLEKIPDSMHHLILPDLQQWDNNYRELNNQYSPYKDLVQQGYDPDDIERAIALQQAINEDPTNFITNAVDYFKTNVPGFNLSLAEAQQLNNENPSFADLNDEEIDVDALKKDPRFAPLFQQVEQQQQFIQQFQESQEDNEAAEELEDYLEELHETHGDFDDDYVTALIAADIDGEDAVQQFKKMISDAVASFNGGGQQNTQQQLSNMQGQQSQVQQPPVIMGQGGSIGSGLPHGGFNPGQMSKKDKNSLVAQMLQAAAGQNNPSSGQ